MGIFNQNLDPTEKKQQTQVVLGAVATGATALMRLIPFNCLLQGFNLGAFGLSGAPTYSLSVFRATSGGLTSIPLGISLTATAFGTSGPIGATIVQPGVTLLKGDMLFMTSGTADTAIAGGVAVSTTSCLGDFKQYQNTLG